MDSEKDINVISDRASKCICNSFDEKLEAPRLSRRDYFAAMAMQGMLGNQKINPQWVDLPLEAVQKADHLLAELSKERSEPGKEK